VKVFALMLRVPQRAPHRLSALAIAVDTGQVAKACAV